MLETLLTAQEQASEIPGVDTVLVEEYPDPMGVGTIYAFHAPLGRPASEAMGRATAARLGRRFGRDLKLVVADLGWSLTLPEGARLNAADLPALLSPEHFEDDVLDGLDRGELLGRRFRHVAATALMVLRRPEGGRTKVGGLLWVSQRLYPLVKAACPDHPLLRETRREVLEETPRRPDGPGMVGQSSEHPIPSPRRPLAVRGGLDRPGRSGAAPVRVAGRGTQEAPSTVDPPMIDGPDGWKLAPEGAAVHAVERVAVIADVHLGYEWARAAGGDCLPSHSLAETLAKLASAAGSNPDRAAGRGGRPGRVAEAVPTNLFGFERFVRMVE